MIFETDIRYKTTAKIVLYFTPSIKKIEKSPPSSIQSNVLVFPPTLSILILYYSLLPALYAWKKGHALALRATFDTFRVAYSTRERVHEVLFLPDAART